MWLKEHIYILKYSVLSKFTILRSSELWQNHKKRYNLFVNLSDKNHDILYTLQKLKIQSLPWSTGSEQLKPLMQLKARDKIAVKYGSFISSIVY